MAAKITIKLTNRSPKQPIKKLPASIEVSQDTTVENVKILLARQAGISDHNRVGLFDPATRKTLKNRNATIESEQAVMAAGELLVKDLGYQVAWRTVFFIEYLGPILFHVATVAVRPYIYPGGDAPLTRTQILAFVFFVSHFLKREVETLFIHKFSASTMPAWNIVRNSFFYWATSGFLCALEIYSPWSIAATGDNQLLENIGTAIFVICEVCNAIVHLNLASLRSRGGTERGIPKGLGTSLVTCPNYMFEIMAWIGVIIATRSIFTVLFISIGASYMLSWGKGKERALRKEFPETYKKKKFVMLPGLL